MAWVSIHTTHGPVANSQHLSVPVATQDQVGTAMSSPGPCISARNSFNRLILSFQSSHCFYCKQATKEGKFKWKSYIKSSQLLKYSWVISQLLYWNSKNRMSTIHCSCISDGMSIWIIRFVCEQHVTVAGGAHNHAAWARSVTLQCYHAASRICIGTRH